MPVADSVQLTPELRLDVQEFYSRYAECLDGGRLMHWPEFFTDSCLYRVTTRQGLRRGPDDDILHMTGKTVMRDRIAAIGQSEDYEPHLQRHFISNFRIQAGKEELRVTANFQVLRTFPEQRSELYASGYYLDRLAVSAGRLNFREKFCVFDSDTPPSSLVYPI